MSRGPPGRIRSIFAYMNKTVAALRPDEAFEKPGSDPAAPSCDISATSIASSPSAVTRETDPPISTSKRDIDDELRIAEDSQ
jgi:hypothetical protein